MKLEVAETQIRWVAGGGMWLSRCGLGRSPGERIGTIMGEGLGIGTALIV